MAVLKKGTMWENNEPSLGETGRADQVFSLDRYFQERWAKIRLFVRRSIVEVKLHLNMPSSLLVNNGLSIRSRTIHIKLDRPSSPVCVLTLRAFNSLLVNHPTRLNFTWKQMETTNIQRLKKSSPNPSAVNSTRHSLVKLSNVPFSPFQRFNECKILRVDMFHFLKNHK